MREEVPIVVRTPPHDNKENPIMTSLPVTELGGAEAVPTERPEEESSQDHAGSSLADSNLGPQAPLVPPPAQPDLRVVETTPEPESDPASATPAMLNKQPSASPTSPPPLAEGRSQTPPVMLQADSPLRQ